MLRPKRMSKVSVAGSKGVMPEVIETVHELNLVHLSDYDGSWDGFDNGNPIEGADDVSEKLVTVRALESTLGLEADDVTPETPDEDWESRLENVRTRINGLDDQRDELRAELREVDEEIDRVAPFAELGIDLDLLSGYDSVEVLVGEGPHSAVEDALTAEESIRAYETFTGGDVVAIVAAPAEDEDDAEGVIDDALVGIEFDRYAVPETEQSPQQYVGQLEDRRRELETEREEVDAELGQLKRAEGGFLLGLEAELSIEAQRADAPLQFATTKRAFIAEGWIPAERYDEFASALRDAVGDSVEIEQLEVADYEDHAHGAQAHTGSGDGEGEEGDTKATTERTESSKAATDGGRSQNGTVTMDEEPPVVLNNITPAKPFELLVKMVGQPKYSELDPTLFVFLTYPFAFGFMIGDIGYGLLYMLMGWGCWKIFDSDAGKALGTIGIWAGVFTVIFGYLYDDIFGIHMGDVGLEFLPLAGALSKGLQLEQWALLWVILSILFGIVHLNIGLVLGFINELGHGVKAAIYERASWILAMNGLFIWIFSAHALGGKPAFLVGEESILNEFVGFTALPEVAGLAGLAMLLVGVVLIAIGEGIAGVFETPAWAFGHVLSYLRMVAVLLAKGGMAFAVNLLVFGAYDTPEGYTYFNYPGLGIEEISGYEYEMLEPGFAGLVHIDPLIVTIPLAIAVFVLGHILVLLLGITAAGIQMLRLEYVEFFQKFYEGSGEEYDPFGHDGTARTQAD
ncbi:V-type ATP synthase subunit I [Natrialbaceae archaeon AArc-T1-2]|uniref:V-type ATP synthase subunit I n=1 Tax=Natrialbaceae archaeon AArc-T1-2 TaxID=3053904 RepID=UPI00255B08AB|nr:V-type ATP synthase subunit I [Natrialbaceae archaeon AArc-T1-2]WIV65793.1 V-type ATP synthase subunit I [Natrialbaceae archaeon AArc-T1-2]